MLRGWRAGRIAGIEVRVDASWPLIAVLLTYTLWVRFADPLAFPEATMPQELGLAVLTVVLFFGSVLAHELAHAAASRARGIPVVAVVLFFFGGATHSRRDASAPFDEFLATAAGPGASFAIGGLFLLAGSAPMDRVGEAVPAMLRYLGAVNLVLGVFNLLPGYPLDGGRLLRALVWRATADRRLATRVTARLGQGLGATLVVGAFGLALATGRLLSLWPALVGWFLFRAAAQALVDAERKAVLASTAASQVMTPAPRAIPADLPIGEAVPRYLVGHDDEAFPVVRDGRMVGWVSLQSVRGVDRARPVADAMMPAPGTVEACPDDSLEAVLDRLADAQAGVAMVRDRGRLVGIVEPGEIEAFLRRASRAPIPSSDS